MDPWLERPGSWQGLHNTLIAALRLRLGPLLRPRYYVALEERTYLAEPEELVFVGRPDITVRGRGGDGPRTKASTKTTAVTVRVPIPDQVRETYLEIRDVAAGEVVTVLELLSPSNKRKGRGRRIYVHKRNIILGTMTNLVEVDLLRAGEPMPLVGEAPSSQYRILVSRDERRPRAELYPFSVRDPIPRFRLPLKRGDAEPEIDLRAVLDEVYDSAGYDLLIDYSKAPVPPLDEADRV